MFGSMEDGWKYKEVLRFICGLMKNPEVLVELICERLLLHCGPRKSEDKFNDSLLDCFRYLEIICKDIPGRGNLSHAKRFSYYCKYGTFEFNPSNLHDGFFGMFDTCMNSREAKCQEPAECAVFTHDIRSFSRGELDRTLGQVVRETKIVVSLLIVISDNDANEKGDVNSAFTESLRFSRNPQVIFMNNCNWLHRFQEDILQKLLGWNKVQTVVLKGIRNISKTLLVGLLRNKPVRVLQIEQCTLDGDSPKALFEELSVCKTLDVLSFAGTEGIRFPLRPVASLSSLKVLNLDKCRFSTSETAEILTNQPLGDLRMISVSGIKLTDDFIFLVNPISNLQNLTSICLINSQLSSRDIGLLAHFLFTAQLAIRDSLSVKKNLRYLCLSQNTLTNQVGCLLSTESTENPLGLKVLGMGEAQLGRNDLNNLERAVVDGRLPELVSLDLSGNNLNMLQERLENLMVACTLHYTRTPLLVYLNDNSFSVVPGQFEIQMPGDYGGAI